MDIQLIDYMNLTSLIITPELLRFITEIDEFKGNLKYV
ncbi:hypothetical protein CRYPA_158 [uncultured Candidatus Thioglobus sp.]|nr:hypothetical protein CRYPA_158 [uncultured Candidatus Thioglobus sp.]